MENLIEKISETRQERLLNPQMSDHFKTFFQGKYGVKIYDIKVGRKWVYIRSNSHRARLTWRSLKPKRLFSGIVMQELTLVQRLTLKQVNIERNKVGGKTMVLNLILQM